MYIQGKYLLAGLHDISECLAIRKEVFGGEQNFAAAAAEDADDKEAIFALAYERDGETLIPVGTGRLLFLGERFKIGRIAVKKEFRGKKYGDFIVRMLVDKAFTMGAGEVYVGAQKHAIPFYETIGFVPVEETYEEGWNLSPDDENYALYLQKGMWTLIQRFKKRTSDMLIASFASDML